MKIGFFTDYYTPSVGGTEISIQNYKAELEKLGHSVYLFCPDYGKNNPPDEEASIIRLPAVPLVRVNGSPLLMLYPGITSRVAAYNLDIVHSMTPFLSTLLADKVARRGHIPHVATLHTLISEQVKSMPFPRLSGAVLAKFGILSSLFYGNWRWIRLFFSRELHRWPLVWRYLLSMLYLADTAVVSSPHVARLLREHNYQEEVAVVPLFSTIPDGSSVSDEYIDSLLDRDKDGVKIVTAGRLAPEKRLDALIEALAKLPPEANCTLFIAGDGPDRPRLEKLSRRLGLDSRVIFCGLLTQPQLSRLMYRSDIFTLVSYRFDTQGIVILDAARNGLPILYCDDDLEIGLDSDNSHLTAPDVEAIALGLERLIMDKELRQKMGKKSLQTAARFSPSELAVRIQTVYESMRTI